MLTTEETKSLLEVLGIRDDISNITLSEVNTAFRELAKVTHPDKVGDDSTSKFQALLNAYEKIKGYFKDNDNIDTDTDDEEVFFRENFEKFNFPFANKGSFTVAIEDHLANTWQDCMVNILGEPKMNTNTECERIWKVSYGNIEKVDITIHLYNNPKNRKGSKLLLQAGKQSVLCSYVFEELPKIYKEVSKNKQIFLEGPKIKRVSKPVVKCDKCKFKSSLIQMKMHMNNVHSRKPTRAKKRFQDFTPAVKSPKKVRNDTILSITNQAKGLPSNTSTKKELFNKTLEVNDEEIQTHNKSVDHEEQVLPEDISLMNLSIEVLAETRNTNQVLNNVEIKAPTPTQSVVISDSVIICGVFAEGFSSFNELEKHMSKHENVKEIKCTSCDSKFETKLEVDIHIETEHRSKKEKCQKCEYSFKTAEELETHMKSQHVSVSNQGLNTSNTQTPIVNQSTKCDQCDYIGNSISDFISHLLQTHKRHPELIECKHCDFRALTLQNYNDHLEIEHVEISILGDLIRSQKVLTKNFEVFKLELTTVLNTIIEAHNGIKQELFIDRQNKQIQGRKLDVIESSINNISKVISSQTFENLNLQSEPKVSKQSSSTAESVSSGPKQTPRHKLVVPEPNHSEQPKSS